MAENGEPQKTQPEEPQPKQEEVKAQDSPVENEMKQEIVQPIAIPTEQKQDDINPPLVEHSPRPSVAEPIKSRLGSIVSFSLPPNQDGKPQPILMDEPEPSGEPKHMVSPTMSPANETNSKEKQDNQPKTQDNSVDLLRRSSFDAIPFSMPTDNIKLLLSEAFEISKSPEPEPAPPPKPETVEEQKEKPEEVVHNVTREESAETLQPPLSISPEIPPEEFHPVSPQSNENSHLDVPAQPPCESDELKKSARSTFEAIAFSDDEEEDMEEEELHNYAEASNQTELPAEETIHIPLSMQISEPQFHIFNDDEDDDSKSVEIPTLTEAVEEKLYGEKGIKITKKSRQNSNASQNSNHSMQQDSARSHNSQQDSSRSVNSQRSQNSGRNNAETEQNEAKTNNRQHQRPHISRLPLERLSNISSAASEEAVQEFSQTGRIPKSPHSQRRVASRICKEREAAIANQDYTKAAEYDDLSRKMTEAVDKQKTEQYRHEQLDILQEKLESARNDHKMFLQDWDDKIKDAEQIMKDRILELGERQQQELDDFEALWNNEDFLRRFSKPSPYLLQLKAQERSMVMTKLFDRAKEYKRMAKAVEKNDTEQAQKRAMIEMNFQKKTLIEKQDKELEVLQKKVTQQLDVLKRQKDVEEVPYIARVKKLEHLYETMKNQGPTANKNQILIQTGYNTKTAQERELPSVRATQRILLSRKEGMAPKLTIKPLGKVLATERKKRTIRIKSATSLK